MLLRNSNKKDEASLQGSIQGWQKQGHRAVFWALGVQAASGYLTSARRGLCHSPSALVYMCPLLGSKGLTEIKVVENKQRQRKWRCCMDKRPPLWTKSILSIFSQLTSNPPKKNTGVRRQWEFTIRGLNRFVYICAVRRSALFYRRRNSHLISSWSGKTLWGKELCVGFFSFTSLAP